MPRDDALQRLRDSILARRHELRERLGGEMSALRKWRMADIGDSADAAFDSDNDIVISQLVEIESSELIQVDRALERMEEGTYGICEHCQREISMARLDALPFTTTCIRCQKAMERARF